jgi:hypothetical protein
MANTWTIYFGEEKVREIEGTALDARRAAKEIIDARWLPVVVKKNGEDAVKWTAVPKEVRKQIKPTKKHK